MEKLHDNIVTEFNHFAEDYTNDMERMVPHYQKLLQSMIEAVPSDFRVNHIMDLGCGNGNVTQLFLGRFPDARYSLVDASPEMLSVCKKRFPNARIKYFETFFQELEAESKECDVIAAGFSLHHLPFDEKVAVFHKTFNWLKKGGLLLSSDLMINKTDDDHPRLLKEWEAYAKSNSTTNEEWKWIMDHYNAYDHPSNFDDQINALQNAGFKEVRIHWNKGYWCSIRAVK